MPRNLLRVALVAAVIPALTPELSSAQTGRPGLVVPAASTAPVQKTGVAGWWQKIRSPKPLPASATPTAKIVRVSAEQPVPNAVVAPTTSIPLEENSDIQLLRRSPMGSRSSRPGSATPQAVPSANAQLAQAKTAQHGANVDQAFPDDVQTARRGRPVVASAPPPPQDVASPVNPSAVPGGTPVPPTSEPEAFPIEAAAPPMAANVESPAQSGTAPQNGPAPVRNPGPAANDVSFAKPMPARPVGQMMIGMNGAVGMNHPPYARQGGPVGFTRLDGAMYPSPQPGIPGYVGSTMITNPALDPHEMLYAHRYRGLYGPFYHKTSRHWVLTPFGICKSEKRVLIGTEVRVNYKSHISPFALFWPPVTH